MSEPKNPSFLNTADVAGADGDHQGLAGSRPIFKTPVAITVARGFLIFLAFLIIVLSGLLMHGYVMDQNVFALVCGFFTLIIVIWELVSEKATSCHAAYNYWAIVSLDFVMVVFWLASMGANAALRAAFVRPVDVDCYNDGSAVNSGHCVEYRRSLNKRAAVTNATGRAEISAIAGLSALQMLLFIGTLAYTAHQVRLHLQGKKKSDPETGNVEMNAQQGQPMLAQQTATYPQYTEQQQYDSQNAYQQSQAYPEQTYSQQTYQQGTQQPYQPSPSPAQGGYEGYGYGQQQTSSTPQPQQQQPYQYPQSQSPAPQYQPSNELPSGQYHHYQQQQ